MNNVSFCTITLVKKLCTTSDRGENLLTGLGPTQICNKKKKKKSRSYKKVFIILNIRVNTSRYDTILYRRHYPTRIFIGKQQVLYSTVLL